MRSNENGRYRPECLLHPETKSTNVIDRYEFVRRGIAMLRIPIFAVTARYLASVMYQHTTSFANIREVNDRVSNVFYVNHRRESPSNSLIILRENKEEKKDTNDNKKRKRRGDERTTHEYLARP